MVWVCLAERVQINLLFRMVYDLKPENILSQILKRNPDLYSQVLPDEKFGVLLTLHLDAIVFHELGERVVLFLRTLTSFFSFLRDTGNI